MSQTTPGRDAATGRRLTCPNCGTTGNTETNTYHGQEITRCTMCGNNQPTMAFALAADVEDDELGVHPAEEAEVVDTGSQYQRL